MARVVFEIHDFDLLQTVFPLCDDGVIRKQIDAFNLDGGSMSNELFPIFLGRIRNGRSHYPKILRAFVAANVEEVAPMIDIIFMIGLAWHDYLPAGIRIVRRDVAELVRRFA